MWWLLRNCFRVAPPALHEVWQGCSKNTCQAFLWCLPIPAPAQVGHPAGSEVAFEEWDRGMAWPCLGIWIQLWFSISPWKCPPETKGWDLSRHPGSNKPFQKLYKYSNARYFHNLLWYHIIIIWFTLFPRQHGARFSQELQWDDHPASASDGYWSNRWSITQEFDNLMVLRFFCRLSISKKRSSRIVHLKVHMFLKIHWVISMKTATPVYNTSASPAVTGCSRRASCAGSEAFASCTTTWR